MGLKLASKSYSKCLEFIECITDKQMLCPEAESQARFVFHQTMGATQHLQTQWHVKREGKFIAIHVNGSRGTYAGERQRPAELADDVEDEKDDENAEDQPAQKRQHCKPELRHNLQSTNTVNENKYTSRVRGSRLRGSRVKGSRVRGPGSGGSQGQGSQGQGVQGQGGLRSLIQPAKYKHRGDHLITSVHSFQQKAVARKRIVISCDIFTVLFFCADILFENFLSNTQKFFS